MVNNIKCRYLAEYCDNSASFWCYQKRCPKRCEEWNCIGDYNGWNEPICKFVRYADAEFSRPLKHYEIDLGESNPTLHLMRGKEYTNILYLEINGRVLIDVKSEEENQHET